MNAHNAADEAGIHGKEHYFAANPKSQRTVVNPAIMLRMRFDGTTVTSSTTRLFEWKSTPSLP
jgi:hypothetical protein